MRRTLIIAILMIASAVAAEPGPTRAATDAEADAIYLGILNSTPVDEAMEMLTDVGVDKARARRLLTYVDEQMTGWRQQTLADTVGLCRNLDGRFSDHYSLAQELTRQQDAQRNFEASMIRHALEILAVDSLVPVRSPHMNGNGSLTETGVVSMVLDGRLTPADAIARACEVTAEDRASVVDKSDAA